MINRDGAAVSLWQDNIGPYAAMNIANENITYDVIIIGGGITGLSTALLLQQEGKKCLLLEAHNLGFGTTGGTTAHINTLLDTTYADIEKNFGKESAKLVYQSVVEAIDHIRNNIQRYQIDCDFEYADAYLFAQDDQQNKELQNIIAATERAGLKTNLRDKIPVPIPFINQALQVDGQAKFNPLKYIYGLARAFEVLGGTLIQHCIAEHTTLSSKVHIETSKGSYKARDLIYATHIPPGVNLLHLRCIPYRSYAMAVKLEDEQYPDHLSYDMQDPYHYYRSQEIYGLKYLIAGGKDHKTGQEENTVQCFDKLESHLRKYFKIKDIAYKWSSQYYESADGLPYIGHLPGQPEHVYVATGFGGNGMVYSSVAALLIKRIMMEEKPFNEKLFDPNRIKPVAGFSNFINHNADLVKQYLGQLFSGKDLQQLAGIAPGEGRVVHYHGHKIALYKNEIGNVYALSPLCTHLGCEVAWNTAEQSWDCPCHGTRYNYKGEVITGPAVRNLKNITIT